MTKTKIIREHTRLTADQAGELHAVNAEWNALRGSHNSPTWNLIKSMQPEFSKAGLGSPWDEFIAAQRAVLAKARAAVAAL